MSLAPELADGAVHVWLARLDDCRDGALFAACGGLLAADERAAEARLLFAPDRRRYRITRALVRTVLSRYVSIDPLGWLFAANAHGKPRVANPEPAARRLSFNVSHSAALVALAVAQERAVGIDVEDLRRRAPLAVARRWFSEAEAQALARCGQAERERHFWALWTLKESYVKARGTGLSLALDSFGFDLSRPGAIRLHCAPACGDDGARWRFSQWQTEPDHLVALCLENDGAASPAIVVRKVVPLGEVRRLPSPIWSCA